MIWAFHCNALPFTKDRFPVEASRQQASQSGRFTFQSMGLHQENTAPATAAGLGPKADVPGSLDRSSAASGLKLIPIVAASGFAGLGYEIVWTRELSLVLGSE